MNNLLVAIYDVRANFVGYFTYLVLQKFLKLVLVFDVKVLMGKSLLEHIFQESPDMFNAVQLRRLYWQELAIELIMHEILTNQRLVRRMVVQYYNRECDANLQVVKNLLHEFEKVFLVGRITSHEDRI